MRRQQPMAVRLDLEVVPGSQFPVSGRPGSWTARYIASRYPCLVPLSVRQPLVDLPPRQWVRPTEPLPYASQGRRGACREWRRITPKLHHFDHLLYNKSKVVQQIHNILTLSHSRLAIESRRAEIKCEAKCLAWRKELSTGRSRPYHRIKHNREALHRLRATVSVVGFVILMLLCNCILNNSQLHFNRA